MRSLTSLLLLGLLLIPVALTAREKPYSQPNIPKDETLKGFQIERVIDGDTIVASGETIRLWGIDAPEKDEPKSYAAKLYLETILNEGPLACEELYKDRYQRTVAKCFSDGKDIGSMIVLMGLATDYKKYSEGHYAFEEQEAKKYKRGMWK